MKHIQRMTDIPFHVDMQDLADRLRLTEDLLEEFAPIFDACVQIAHPKMIYGTADVARLKEPIVQVDKELFESRILYGNMEGIDKVYPYVCTSGREVYEYALSLSEEPLYQYWADCASESILRSAMMRASAQIEKDFGTKTLYAMSPGSLPDWPMPEQRPLFRLLGDVMGEIGVELTDSCLMLPVKSISGLLFESDRHYSNCSMCPREGCPNRSVPYNPDLSMDRYGLDM